MLGDEYEVHGLDIVDPQVPLNEFYRCDIKRPFEVPGDIEYDAVIHLAALVNVGESEAKPISYYITNLNGTMNVINKVKTKNFIFASTGAAVGCESAYGISKRAAEDVVREFCTNHRPTPYTIFRFYNVIGSTVVAPSNPDGLMYNLMKARETGEFTIFGSDYDVSPDGTCIRDYVHVNEICDALKQAIEKPSNSVESLGHGVGYTVNEIVNLFQRVNDTDFNVRKGPRRKGDLASSVLEDVSPYMRNLYTMEELLKVQRL
jgi:UDP-glucose 4-epimerase